MIIIYCSFKVGRLVLLNHKRSSSGYYNISNFRICKAINERAFDLQDPSG